MNEFQRQKRDREFQLAVLNAVGEKKKTGKLFGFINSAAFLWFMTLIVVTVGGALISERQQCFRDAQSQIELYDKLEAELNHRQSQIRQMVAAAKSVDELGKSLQSIAHYSPEFAQFSTLFLTQQHWRLQQQIAPEFALVTAHNEKLRPVGDAKAHMERIRFAAITSGQLPQNITDADLSALKSFVNPVTKMKVLSMTVGFPDPSNNPFGSLSWAFFGPKLEASCGAGVLLTRLWSGSYGTRNVVPVPVMYELYLKTLRQSAP